MLKVSGNTTLAMKLQSARLEQVVALPGNIAGTGKASEAPSAVRGSERGRFRTNSFLRGKSNAMEKEVHVQLIC